MALFNDRQGYERHDTRGRDPFRNYDTRECACRDTGFNCNQGRTCPNRMAQQRPKPRVPRTDKASPIAVIVIGIVALLSVIAVVSSALRVTP
jgi:hypothetical protein